MQTYRRRFGFAPVPTIVSLVFSCFGVGCVARTRPDLYVLLVACRIIIEYNSCVLFYFRAYQSAEASVNSHLFIWSSPNLCHRISLIFHNVFVRFFSPTYVRVCCSEKLSHCELLAVDEAAAIPLPLVKSLLGPYLVFLSSTVNGYEGTGRALSLKLIDQLRKQQGKEGTPLFLLTSLLLGSWLRGSGKVRQEPSSCLVFLLFLRSSTQLAQGQGSREVRQERSTICFFVCRG